MTDNANGIGRKVWVLIEKGHLKNIKRPFYSLEKVFII